MKERPILFSAPMVRALLAGTKTQTRRVARTENTMGRVSILALRQGKKHAPVYLLPEHKAEAAACCPYGQPGDRLWVREAWFDAASALHSCVLYRASDDHQGNAVTWRPSIHMPRWASRITLEITSVRVEPLQAISDADCIAEGIERYSDGCGWKRGALQGDQNLVDRTAFPRLAYQSIWESIHGPDSWAANPWVWVVEFRRLS